MHRTIRNRTAGIYATLFFVHIFKENINTVLSLHVRALICILNILELKNEQEIFENK